METLDGCADVFGNEEWSNSSLHEENVNSLAEKFSEFGDSSCGEPLYSQRLLLDFTPNEEIDNDYAQKKCCDFWNFINSRPEIQHLMVLPERLQDLQKSDTLQGSSKDNMSGTEEKSRLIDSKQRTALSMLKFAEDKGLIDRTFEAKIRESHCTMGSREYRECEKGTERKKIQCGPICACMRTESGVIPTLCVCNPPKPTPLKTLVRTMQEWDPKHPKSFEPPSHPPSLQHCVLQRKPVSSNRSK